MSLHYIVKYLCSKNDRDQEEIEANYHVRLSHSKISCKKYFLVKYLLVKPVTRRRSHRPYKKSHYRLYTTAVTKITRSSAIAEGPRDESCQLTSCQLPRNSAETTCTTSPEQIEVMKLEL